MAGFKISTNIERDQSQDINFILTKNTDEVYERIAHHYARGQRAFSIIGSYGTGKSTFLWALDKHLNGQPKFSKSAKSEFKGVKGFSFQRIIGESTSFKGKICHVFGLKGAENSSNKKILNEFEMLLEEIKQQGLTLVLVVDEFGKQLEYISKHNPDELYFLQELAEFCNDPQKNIIWITTLHQNFSTYAKGLTKAERSEWDKVRGRFIDIAFDEPVEQLLFFAAERLKGHHISKKWESQFKRGIKSLFKHSLITGSLETDFDKFEKLFPLDPLAADIITKTLQRFGQNERSLFTFLDSKELMECIDGNAIFTLPDCFDYLMKNLSGEIEDGERNPFKPQFKAAALALERAEFIFETNFEQASFIIKTICLVNIFSGAKAVLDKNAIDDYAAKFGNFSDTLDIIALLESKKIIKYSNYRSKYNFIEGTDVDIEQEIIDASNFVDSEFDLVSRLEEYFHFPLIPAKRIQFEYGAPRFFGFKFFNEIPNKLEEPSGELDGFINLVFSNKRIEGQLREFINQQSPCQIIVLYKEIDEIRESVLQLDKINFALSKQGEDKVAQRILNEEKQFKLDHLRELVEGALFDKHSRVKWLWNDRIDCISSHAIYSYTALNRLLSDACQLAYSDSPRFLNEMVNREILSSPILTARKALIRQMINCGDQIDLGFDSNLFPPEKTIYLSLLKQTGIHIEHDGFAGYSAPSDQSFKSLWFKCEEILQISTEGKMSIEHFYSQLKTGSFKLKQGLLDFWIPIFLIIKKEDYSLYSDSGEYIPMLNTDVMDLIYKHPGKFFIKALGSKGVNNQYLSFYKELVGYNESNIKGLQSSYITIYGNFLRFYRGLEEYAQKTKNLSPQAIGVRKAIANANDPESALFTDIPDALGFYGLEKGDKRLNHFLETLQLTIREIRSAYDTLVDSLQKEISDALNIQALDFDDFKSHLNRRFENINRNLILNEKLKLLFTRLVSPLDVKKAYWESISDVIVGKKLDRISDEEIPIFIDRLKDMLSQLDDIAPLHQIKNNNHNLDVIQLSISDGSGSRNIKKTIVVDNKKRKKADDLLKDLETKLSSDNELNKMVLAQMLEKLLNKNE